MASRYIVTCNCVTLFCLHFHYYQNQREKLYYTMVTITVYTEPHTLKLLS